MRESRIFCLDVWHIWLYVCVFIGKLQQKMRTSTAEALSRLDVVGAVRDHRRFNYVCKVTIISFHIVTSYSALFRSFVHLWL